jgi:fatty acid synthase subunit alpha, fungi type
MSEMMIKNNLVKIKEHPPYSLDLEDKVLLNSLARVSPDAKTGSYAFTSKLPTTVVIDSQNVKLIEETLSDSKLGQQALGVGVDQELISSVPSHNPTFVSRNFTPAEIAYCSSQPSPASSFAARWVGKEAVFKSLGVKSKGAGASLIDIEIINDGESGAPKVVLHGDAKKMAEGKGVKDVLISLSHSDVSLLRCLVVP